MFLKSYTVTLTDKESRALHDVDRMIAEWKRVKPFSNREQPMWDVCEAVIADLTYLRDEILLAKDDVELSNNVHTLPEPSAARIPGPQAT